MHTRNQCVYVLHSDKSKKHKVFFTNFRIHEYLVMSVKGKIHNAYNLYIITNTVTIVPTGNFTKERNNL